MISLNAKNLKSVLLAEPHVPVILGALKGTELR